MGFFDKIFKHGRAFNRLAKSYKEALDCIIECRLNFNVQYLYKAVWIFTNCIVASVEKWHWKMTAKIYIPDYIEKLGGSITVLEASAGVASQIAEISKNLTEEENSIVERVMSGEFVPEVERFITDSLKEKLLP